MQVELSNFLDILSCGAFDTPLDNIQPMSQFKWQRIKEYAAQEKVEMFTIYGMQRSVYGPDILDKDQRKSAEEMYNFRRRLYADFENRIKPVTKFSNIRLRLKLSKLFNSEVHKMDAQVPMLALLDMIANFLKEAFMGRISYLTIIKIGLYLRQRGHKVDFNTLDDYISELGLEKVANLIGTILVKVFGFHKDEIQFLKNEDSKYMEVIEHYFTLSLGDFISLRHKTKAGTLRAIGLNDHRRISAQRGKYYARYHRSEAFSSFFVNLGKSVTEIEE